MVKKERVKEKREKKKKKKEKGKKRDFSLLRDGGRSVDLPAPTPEPKGVAILQR